MITLKTRKAAETSGEEPLAAKVIWIEIINFDATDPAAKLDRMVAVLNLSKVLQLPTVRSIDCMPNLRTPADKRSAYIKDRLVEELL